MLRTIEEARADLVSTLSDTGYTVAGYDQPKVLSGSIILNEADPFLTFGEVLGTLAVNFDVLLFQNTRNLEAATKAMDEMVMASVMNLGEWTLTNLRSHQSVQLVQNGPIYLMSTMSVTNLLYVGNSN